MATRRYFSMLLITLIRQYQEVAPDRIRNSCRFEPTCSSYAILAIEKYGAWRGSLLAVKRLLKCRPPNCGYDPLE